MTRLPLLIVALLTLAIGGCGGGAPKQIVQLKDGKEIHVWDGATGIREPCGETAIYFDDKDGNRVCIRGSYVIKKQKLAEANP